MSFGIIDEIFNKTIDLLKNRSNLEYNELNIIKNEIYYELQSEFNDVTREMVEEIINRLYKPKYKIRNVTFENGKNCFREYEETYPDFKVPIKYKKLEEQFLKLKKLPQPEQRTKAWFDYRYNRITASDTAAAIDLNPYEPVESFILKKCDPDFPFLDNATVFHGKKYEPTATMIYEHIYNNRVFEFGALPSEKYNFLGASPDGICSKYSLDNKFSDRLGTMLEIKCPVTREIQTSGKITDICPFYYFCQVQQQLACCELDICDFWQCKLSEYKTRTEYLVDNCSLCKNTIGLKAEKIVVDNKLKKGLILEFYPKNFTPAFEGDEREWKSKYIIPKRLDMNEQEYDTWTLNMMNQYKELYPEIDKHYYFNKIIYWKLESSHNLEIKRDDEFLDSIIPILRETWEKVKYYRKNQNKLDEMRSIAEKRKKYVRINTNYTINNQTITTNNYLFLDTNFDCSVLCPVNKKHVVKKAPVKKEENDECDFVD
jgi:putative phage-type endonuclease